MKKIFAAITSLVLALGMLTGTATAAPVGFVNPSFENGLNGWTATVPLGGFAGSVTSFGEFYPVNGQRFALLKTDGTNSFTTLSQTFSVQAGDAISGWAFFKTTEIMPCNYFAQVQIVQGSTGIPVFGASVQYTGTRPWTFWTYEFAAAGTYTLRASIANLGPGVSSGINSALGLDLIVFRVAIDVKPGGYPNSINLNSKGVVLVALLTTPIFNATCVDLSSVAFAGASPLRQHLEDVDNDGDLDYVFQFATEDLVISGGQDYAQLKARTNAGYLIGGLDSINLVP